MEYFLKENKKFLIAVGGALVFVLLYNLFVLTPLVDAGTQTARRRKTEEDSLKARMAQGDPSEDTLALARRELDRTEKLLATSAADSSFKEETAFKEEDRIRKPEGESFKAHLDNVKLDLYKKLQEKAVKAQIAFAVPMNFGLDTVDGGAADEIADKLAGEVLLRLMAVQRLVLLAIESEVSKIETIDVFYATDLKDEPVTKAGVFLNRYSVFIKFTGKSEAVFKVLHGVQKRGAYLAVSHFEAVREDAAKDLFSASLGVSLLKVDEKAPIEAKGAEPQ